MKALTPDQLAAIHAQTTGPCFAFEVELDEVKHWSTRQRVDWSGNLFEPGFLQVGKITNEEANFSFYNEGFAHTNNALNGVYMRKRVRIWCAYGPEKNGGVHYAKPGYWKEFYTVEPESGDPEPFLYFDGTIYATPSIDNWISVVAKQTPPKKFPSPRLQPPFANHLPSAGYTIPFDGAVLTIEGQA